MTIAFNLKSQLHQHLIRESVCPLTPGTDFSRAMKVLGGIFFQQKIDLFTLTCCLLLPLSVIISAGLLDNSLQPLYQYLLFHLVLSLLRKQLFSINLMDQPLPLHTSTLPHLSQPSQSCSGLVFGLRGCCDWFYLLSRPLKCSPYPQ